jgi:hypothetical protein
VRDTLERWLTLAAVILSLSIAALRHAHRASMRRRLRRQAGAYR